MIEPQTERRAVKTLMLRIVSGHLALLMAIASTGCAVNPGGNFGDGDLDPEELDPAVTQAVESVSDQLESVFAALTTGVTVDPDVVLDPPDSGCPAVETEIVGTSGVVTFDYGDGCASTLFDGAVVAGAVRVTLEILTQAITLDYFGFALDNRTLDGQVGVELTTIDPTNRSIGVTMDITTQDVGSIDGTMTVTSSTADDGREIIITQGEFRVADTATSRFYDVTAQQVVSNRAKNGTAAPEGGTVSFEIAGAGPGGSALLVVVTFTADTPLTGVVLVQVGSLAAVEYQLLGL
jgi:hypothetical protein